MLSIAPWRLTDSIITILLTHAIFPAAHFLKTKSDDQLTQLIAASVFRLLITIGFTNHQT